MKGPDRPVSSLQATSKLFLQDKGFQNNLKVTKRLEASEISTDFMDSDV